MLRKAFHPQTFLLFHPKCSSDPPSHPLNSPKNHKPEGNRRYLLYSAGYYQTGDGDVALTLNNGEKLYDFVWLYEATPDSNAAEADN
jgi:hypothetical protein